MKNALLFPFILLLLIPTAAADAWVIEDETICQGGELTIEDDITITSTGSLTLIDCTLIMDTPAYNNGWLNVGIEGLKITVEDGGSLAIRTETGQAGIEPADDQYGYTIHAEGDIAFTGSKDNPVLIRGLEGYMAQTFIGGGITVEGGQALLSNVSFEDIYGPALFMVDGGKGVIKDISVVRASGAFAASNSTLEVHRATANMGFETIRVTKSNLDVFDSELLAGRISVSAIRSHVDIHNSTIASAQIGIQLSDSSLNLTDSKVRYQSNGITHEKKPERGINSTVILTNNSINNFGLRPEAMAMVLVGADVEARSNEMRNYTQGGVNVYGGSLIFEDNIMSGQGSFHLFAQNTPELVVRNIEVDGDVVDPFVYLKDLKVLVTDASGPVNNATVQIMDTTVFTDVNGTVVLDWTIAAMDDGSPEFAILDVLASNAQLKKSGTLSFDEPEIELHLTPAQARGIPGLGTPGFAFGLLLAGVAFLARRP